MCALLLLVCVVRACVRSYVCVGEGLTLPFWSDQAYANTGCTLVAKVFSQCWRLRLAEAAAFAALAVATRAFFAYTTPQAIKCVQGARWLRCQHCYNKEAPRSTAIPDS